jgi:hypothetical protein
MCRTVKLFGGYQRSIWVNAVTVNSDEWYISIYSYRTRVMDQRLELEFWAPAFSEHWGPSCGLVVATLVARTVRCLCTTLASPFYRFLARYSGERYRCLFKRLTSLTGVCWVVEFAVSIYCAIACVPLRNVAQLASSLLVVTVTQQYS